MDHTFLIHVHIDVCPLVSNMWVDIDVQLLDDVIRGENGVDGVWPNVGLRLHCGCSGELLQCGKACMLLWVGPMTEDCGH